MSLVVCTYDKSPYHAKVNEKIQWDEELKLEVQIYIVCVLDSVKVLGNSVY